MIHVDGSDAEHNFHNLSNILHAQAPGKHKLRVRKLVASTVQDPPRNVGQPHLSTALYASCGLRPYRKGARRCVANRIWPCSRRIRQRLSTRLFSWQRSSTGGCHKQIPPFQLLRPLSGDFRVQVATRFLSFVESYNATGSRRCGAVPCPWSSVSRGSHVRPIYRLRVPECAPGNRPHACQDFCQLLRLRDKT